MKRIALLILLAGLLCPWHAQAQGNVVMLQGSGAPAGSCPFLELWNQTNAPGLYYCDRSTFTWVQLDASGVGVTCAQLPALTGDTTTSAGSCATTTSKLNGTSVLTNITSPILYGGAAAGSTITLNGTSNGSPSLAYVLLNPTNGQNVGVGTATPLLPLDVRGVSNAGPAASGTVPTGTASFIATVNGNSLFIGSYTASPLAVWLQAANFAALNLFYPLALNPLGGNVGIGTNNPGALLDLGLAGTTLGVMRLAGSGTGNITIQPQATAGTATLTLPNTAGTIAASATSPVTLNATTGAIGCATCLTSSSTSPVLASIDLTAQTAAKTATNLYLPTATGMIRVSYYAKVTTVGSISSILGGTSGLVIAYTDGTDSVAQTAFTAPEDNQAGNALSVGSGNTTNTNQAVLQGSATIFVKTGVQTTYAFGYTSVNAAEMAYELHIRVEGL